MKLTRREFLKTSGLFLATLGIRPVHQTKFNKENMEALSKRLLRSKIRPTNEPAYSINFADIPDGPLPDGLDGSTWQVLSGLAVNNPETGPNLIVNGEFDNWSNNNPSNWTIFGENGTNPEISQVGPDEGHGGIGIGACNLYTSAGANVGLYETGRCSVNQWYLAAVNITHLNSGKLRIINPTGYQYGNYPISDLGLNPCTFWGIASGNFGFTRLTGYPNDITFDSVTLNRLSISQLCFSTDLGLSDIRVSASLIVRKNLHAGVWICQDGSKTNGILALYDGTNAILLKLLNGVFSILINLPINYSDGAPIEVRKLGTNVQLWYNGIQIGPDKTVTDDPIINNTIHGAFSSDSRNGVLSFTVSTNVIPKYPKSFVWIMDPHIGATGALQKLQTIITNINSLNPKPEFVAVGGDLVNDSKDQYYTDFINAMSSLTIPYYVLPGNHEEYSSGLAVYDRYFPSRHFSIEIGDFQIVGYHSRCSTVSDLSGRIETNELAWLDGEIQNHSDRHIVCITHYPIIDHRFGHVILQNQGGSDLVNLLEANGIQLHLSGHSHVDCDRIEANGILYVNGPSAWSNPNVTNTDGGYVICRIIHDSISMDYRTASGNVSIPYSGVPSYDWIEENLS
jgi:hypothetical protein